MKKNIISLFLILSFFGCTHSGGDGAYFSSKWKSSTPEQRREMANAEILYGYLSNRSKDDVVVFLGNPDKIDEFGDFIYSLGRAKANGHEFDVTCLVAFDNGPMVKRIELTSP